MKSAAISVGTTPTLILGADDLARQVYLHNAGGSKTYLGDSDVTTSTGFVLDSGGQLAVYVPGREAIYGVVSSGSNTVTILLPNSD